MADLITVTYKHGDEEEINRLFEAVFGKKRTSKEWEWKFANGPIDARPYIVLAKDGEKLIGQYAIIAFYIKYLDRKMVVVQPVDNMVHQDYRGGVKGVQVKMFVLSEELWRQAGIDLAFGFPNRQAYVVGKRLLKYRDLIKIENYFKRLSWRTALRKRIKIPFLVDFLGWFSRLFIRLSVTALVRSRRDVYYQRVCTFDERIDSFWEKVKNQYEILVCRDRRYLNWRYCQNPRLIIVKYEEHDDVRIGFIMECLALKEPLLMEGLIKKALLCLSGNRTDYVLVRLASGDSINNAFKRFGFSSRPGIWESNFVYKTYSSNVNSAELEDQSKWHVSFGDSDSL
jgi:hypothetical protein